MRRRVYFLLAALFFSVCSYAQDFDAALEQELGMEEPFSAAERAVLNAALEKQPDPGARPEALSEFYWEQVRAAQRLGDVSKELEILEKWLASAGDNPQLQAKPTWLLRRANIKGGDVKAALHYAERMVPLISATENPFLRIQYLCGLSRNYTDVMDFARAGALLQSAEQELDNELRLPRVKPLREFNRIRMRGFIVSTRSWLQYRQGKYADAEKSAMDEVAAAKKALDMQSYVDTRSFGEMPLYFYAGALEDLMRAQLGQGHLPDAAATAAYALHFFKEKKIAGYHLNSIYLLISSLKLAQHDVRRAEYYARTALRTTKGRDGQYLSKPGISAHHRLIDVLVVKRNWDEALAVYSALGAGTAGNEVAGGLAERPLVHGLILMYSGRLKQGLELLKKSSEGHLRTLGPRHIDTVLAQGLYAVALAKDGQHDAALGLFTNAVRDMHSPDVAGSDIAEQGLKQAFRQMIQEEYLALLLKMPPDAGRREDAFRTAEYLRGSVVEQAVVDSAVRAAAGIAGLGELVRAEQDAKNELAVLQDFLARHVLEPSQRRLPGVIEKMRKRIVVLQEEIGARHREITKRFPDYDALIHPHPPSIAEVAKRLAPDEAFISIVPTSTQVLVFAVSDRGSAFSSASIAPSRLDFLVDRLRDTLDLSTADIDALDRFEADAAYRIYEAVLAPVAHVWKGKTRLSISPYGKLAQIPFSVLLTAPISANPRTDAVTLRNAPWFIRMASISHLPTASSWVALRDTVNLNARQSSHRSPFFGFGDPLFNLNKAASRDVTHKVRGIGIARDDDESALISSTRYERIPPLPETREEIIAIANALGADPQRNALFGREASRKNVLNLDLQQHQIIAFATHGLASGDLPNLSQPALAMAATESDKESPLLTLEDILRLKLDADWIVLSACNTAAADGEAAEAISGLGRGFFYAGAKALLVTHWAVETQSAAALTTMTFRRFGSDRNLLRAEALRQAQLEMIASRDFSHPFFWAPYALIGDGGR